jgi:hypothetical protein
LKIVALKTGFRVLLACMHDLDDQRYREEEDESELLLTEVEENEQRDEI